MAAPYIAPPAITDLDARKLAMRRDMRDRAEIGSVSDHAALCAHFERFIAETGRSVIACVWPLAGEPDLRPLMAALHGQGHVVALPVVTARAAPLAFHRWDPTEALVPGPFGTFAPRSDGRSVCAPDLIAVPLVAFDAQCRRLGRGGGYYDRTLAAHAHALAVGFAFACRAVACVPTGPFDVPLDAVITEAGVVRPAGSPDTNSAVEVH